MIFRSTSFGCPSREVPHIFSGRGSACLVQSVRTETLESSSFNTMCGSISLQIWVWDLFVHWMPAPDPTMASKAFSLAALGLPGLFSARDVCRQQGPRVQQDVPPLPHDQPSGWCTVSICFFSRLNSWHILFLFVKICLGWVTATFHWRNFGAMVSCSLLILSGDYHPAQLEPGEHETQNPVRDSDFCHFCGASFCAPEVDMILNVSKNNFLQIEDCRLSKNATFSASPARWTFWSQSYFIHILYWFWHFVHFYSWHHLAFGIFRNGLSVADDLDLLILCPFRSLRLIYVILLFCFGRLEFATWAAAIAVHGGTAFYIALCSASFVSSLCFADCSPQRLD